MPLQVTHIRQHFAAANTAHGVADIASLSYTSPFSRRTSGHAIHSYVRNIVRLAIPLDASSNQISAAGPGADPRGFAVGVRHSF